jgi:hypothetical protein
LRGCLSVLLIAAAFFVATVWFGGPPLAESVVEASLTGSGLTADELDVTVTAEPPLVLALGRADRIQIEATGVRWKDLRAGSMSMQLNGVDLVGRTAITAYGQFREVELAVPGGDPALVGITIAGLTEDANATIDIDAPTVSRIAITAFEQEFGSRPDSIELVAPDQIRARFGGNSLGGTLRVEGGALVLPTSVGTFRLVEPDPSIPLRLSGVAVDATGLALTGTIDLRSLLR